MPIVADEPEKSRTGPGSDRSAEASLKDFARRSVDEDARNEQFAAWIARIAARDEAALGLLYDALLGKVYGVVRRIVRRPELAEEVTEDVFFQIWRQANRFDIRRGRPLGWILTIARTRALDRLRNAEAATPSGSVTLDARDDSAPSMTPYDLLEACEESGRLHDALVALEPLPRQIVALAFFRGLTHEEIAVHLGLALGTVKSHVRRALSRLQRALEDHVDRARKMP